MTSNLPLVRLSAANPFLLELGSRKLPAVDLLRELDLPEMIPASDELFISSNIMYQIVEKAGEVAADPYFGFSIGQNTDLRDWVPIATAFENASTVGDLLHHFIVNATHHSSSTRFFIRTEADIASFGFRRLVKPSVVPAQNDAFYLGLLKKLLEAAARELWDPMAVFFTVADPGAIPALPGNTRVSKGDRLGMQIRFPAAWLLERIEKSSFSTSSPASQRESLPRSLVESLHLALLPHIHEPDLNVARAAHICGFARQRLSAELRSRGTTLRREIAELRSRQAKSGLINSDRAVFDIAQTVGFRDPTVFSRAFKNWTGQSPQEYRRTHR